MLLRGGEKLSITEISRKTGGTYAHIVRVIQKLVQLELIQFEKVGRTKLVNLTPLGELIAEKAEELACLFEIAKLSSQISQFYRKEIRGKLRADMNKQKIIEVVSQARQKLKELENKAGKFATLELERKLEEIEREAKGILL